MLQLAERLNLLEYLQKILNQQPPRLEGYIHRTSVHNPWFTKENIRMAISAITEHFLDREKLEAWIAPYKLEPAHPKTVGLVMAGNIPLVGFHDFLSVFISGNKAQIKLSDKDPYLFPAILKLMRETEPRVDEHVQVVERLAGFDAVIATGSNNTSRYFDAYFGHYPNIIRKSRTSVAVLSGQENDSELDGLNADVFHYFGLGCRNVSKIYLPAGYDLQPLMEHFHKEKKLILHSKYKNNYDYNVAMFMLNQTPYLASGSLILLENKSINSRIASLHYEYYDKRETVSQHLKEQTEELQCIVAKDGWLEDTTTVPFGKTQQPELSDYADNVDTLAFLADLDD